LRAIASIRSTHLDKPVEAVEGSARRYVILLAATTPAATAETETMACGGQSPATIFSSTYDPGVRDAVREMLESHGWAGRDLRELRSRSCRRCALGGPCCLVIDAVLPEWMVSSCWLGSRPIKSPAVDHDHGHGDVSLAVKAMQAGASDFHREAIRPRGACASIKRRWSILLTRARARAAYGRAGPSRWLTTRQRQF